MPPDIRVEERESGLAVVVDEEARQRAAQARRDVRKASKQARRQKAADRLSARRKGHADWKARSKQISRVANGLQAKNPGMPRTKARDTAKLSVMIGEQITEYAINSIIRVPDPTKGS